LIVSSNILEFLSPMADLIFSGFLYTILIIIFTYIFPQVFSTSRGEIRKYINIIISKYLKPK
jgi:hypothetical protein